MINFPNLIQLQIGYILLGGLSETISIRIPTIVLFVIRCATLNTIQDAANPGHKIGNFAGLQLFVLLLRDIHKCSDF